MLHRTWVAPLVVGFWCVTTAWLVVSKILPTFRGGVSPHQAAVALAGDQSNPVGWTVLWNGSPIGWAITDSRRDPDGGLTIDSRLRCDRLPLDEMLPRWAGALMQRTLPRGDAATLDARGSVVVDSTGRFVRFTSTVALPGSKDEKVVLEGAARDGDEVDVTFRAGDLRYETTRHVPEGALLGDEFSPQAALPGLFEGRTWTVPVYNPLRPGTAPITIMHATAEGEETIFWGNRLVAARVVTYRDDPSSPREPRSRLWVDRAGLVLRQESMLLGGRMEFVRRTDAEAARLAAVAALVDAAGETTSATHPPAEAGP
ncbi:MAG: hypothetical protein ACKOSQ_06470 [Planctomycetaceae bacterium]